MPAPYKLNDERLEDEWNQAWRFIDTLDLAKEVRMYIGNKGYLYNIGDFMEYLDYKYPRKDTTLFNCISIGDLEEYINVNYKGKLSIDVVTRIRVV